MQNKEGWKMKNRILILTGGRLETDFVKKYLESQEEPFSFIICADRGLEAAHEIKLKVDGIVGDFDSLEQKKILEEYKLRENVEIRSFMPEKDWTDTHLAIDFALEKNPEEIIILGGTGTRLDHVLGNLNLLMVSVQQGVMTYMIDSWNKICLLQGPVEYSILREKAYGKYVSVMPFTPIVNNVTLEGFKYPLQNADMTMGNTLGISNEIVEEKARITMERGYLMIIESDDIPRYK